MACLSQWESKWVHLTGPVSRHVDLDRPSVIQSRSDAECVSDPVFGKGLRNGFRASPTGGNLSAFIEVYPGRKTARTRSSVRAEVGGREAPWYNWKIATRFSGAKRV